MRYSLFLETDGFSQNTLNHDPHGPDSRTLGDIIFSHLEASSILMAFFFYSVLDGSYVFPRLFFFSNQCVAPMELEGNDIAFDLRVILTDKFRFSIFTTSCIGWTADYFTRTRIVGRSNLL